MITPSTGQPSPVAPYLVWSSLLVLAVSGCASTAEFSMSRGPAVADTIRAHAPVMIHMQRQREVYYLSDARVIADSLRMQFFTGRRLATVPLSEVASIHVAGPKVPMKAEGVLAGALVGGVLGSLVGRASVKACEPDPEILFSCFGDDLNRGAGRILGSLVGVLVGGFIGGGIGSRGRSSQIVYRLTD